jgi:hypothetical protein
VIIAKITAVSFATLLIAAFALWGVSGMANYSASFLAFLLVAAASFAGYRRVVLSSAGGDVDIEKTDEDDEENEAKPSKMSLLLKTYKGWIFPLRLVSYAIFVLVFLYFANNNLLNIFAFLTGIAVLPISVLIFILFFRREF